MVDTSTMTSVQLKALEGRLNPVPENGVYWVMRGKLPASKYPEGGYFYASSPTFITTREPDIAQRFPSLNEAMKADYCRGYTPVLRIRAA